MQQGISIQSLEAITCASILIPYRTWHMHHAAAIKDGHDNQGFLEVVSCQKNWSVNFYISAYTQSFD